MVAQFVRLKLTLMANAFRRSVWQTVGFVLGSLYALGIVGLLVVAAIAGGAEDVAVTGQVLVVAGSVLVLGWWLVPVFLYGVDATLDPLHFATYGIRRPQLLAGLGLAAVISVPGLATLLTVLGAALAWWRSPLALLAGFVGAVGALALCVVGSRAITTTLAPMLESRRSKELLAGIVIIPLMLLGPAISWGTDRMVDATDGEAPAGLLRDLSDLLGWTPLGAPWGMAVAVEAGHWLAAAGRLGVVLASVALLLWVWDRGMTRSFERPVRSSGRAKQGKGLGLLGRVPATPVGAVVARTSIYWIRDPRYSISIVVMALLPVVLFVTGRASGGATMVMVAPLVAWMLGFAISNDIAFDDTAFALHVSTGVPGRVDRWGRAIPVLVAGVPLVVLFVLLACALSGNWDWAVPLLGLSLGTLGTSTGVSSFVSTRWLYPVPKPGESPLKTPQGATGATMLAQTVSGGLLFVLRDRADRCPGQGRRRGLVSQRWVVQAVRTRRRTVMMAFARATQAAWTGAARSVTTARAAKPRLCQEFVRSTCQRRVRSIGTYSPLGLMFAFIPSSLSRSRVTFESYPASRWTVMISGSPTPNRCSRRPRCSRVGRSSGESLRFAPARTTPSGTPAPSTSTDRFRPLFPRSTGERPVLSPPHGALTMHPSTATWARSRPTIWS